MTDAEINSKVRNYIANTSNQLLEQASPFPSDDLKYTQQCVYECMQKLGKLYQALVEYNDKQKEDLLRIL